MTGSEAWRVEVGDCLDVLDRLPADSVDAVVCDPPYGLSRAPDTAEVLRHWLAGDDYAHRGGGFMGQSWDSFVPGPATWRACLRVLKPGGHLLAFGGTRTADLLAIAIRLAGFEIRDEVLGIGPRLDWLYGSGWPKSRNIGKAIDARAGAEREVLDRVRSPFKVDAAEDRRRAYGEQVGGIGEDGYRFSEVTEPATPEAARWEGWGTALKPAHEPIVVARKPFRVTVEEQVLATGTGALNIDATRIDSGPSPSIERRQGVPRQTESRTGWKDGTSDERYREHRRGEQLGRWPANVVLLHDPACERVGTRRVPTGTTVRRNLDPAEHETSIFAKRKHPGGVDVTYGDGDGLETIEAWSCAPGCPVALLDEQAGELRSGDPTAVGDAEGRAPQNAYVGESRSAGTPIVGYGDQGGASRFLYQAKASPAEREFGLSDLDVGGTTKRYGTMQEPKLDRAAPREHWTPREVRNVHPTVKPIDLMRWLVRLAVPRGGLVLDPFTGSGTTGCAAVLEGVRFLGVERDEDYAAIARRRVRAWAAYPPGTPTGRVLGEDAARRRAAEEVQERRRELADAGQLDLLAGAEG